MLPSLQKFHHLTWGQAEIRTLPLKFNEEEVHAVGTHGCRTCMCVYVRLKNDAVFYAHMVAHTLGKPKSLTEEEEAEEEYDEKGRKYLFTWTSDLIRGCRLKRLVLAQLRSELPPDICMAEPVEAFAVCPAIFYHEKTANGWWLQEAVREFFQIQEEDFVLHWGHGFAAGPGEWIAN